MVRYRVSASVIVEDQGGEMTADQVLQEAKRKLYICTIARYWPALQVETVDVIRRSKAQPLETFVPKKFSGKAERRKTR